MAASGLRSLRCASDICSRRESFSISALPSCTCFARCFEETERCLAPKNAGLQSHIPESEPCGRSGYFYKRFCRGKTARLCVNDIAGIHKKGYMIGIPDNMDPFVKMKFFPQNAFDFALFPQMITMCSPFRQRSANSAAKTASFPNPILPLMTRNIGTSIGRCSFFLQLP